jgi:hypothetical protein
MQAGRANSIHVMSYYSVWAYRRSAADVDSIEKIVFMAASPAAQRSQGRDPTGGSGCPLRQKRPLQRASRAFTLGDTSCRQDRIERGHEVIPGSGER